MGNDMIRTQTAVKKSIFLMALVFIFGIKASSAVVYYVDATGGRDDNSGLSPLAPWKSIAKVNKTAFAPGDQILFKRGEAWREALKPNSSGTTNNPILFAAYGTGNPPRILGSESYAGAKFWIQETAFLWYTADVNWIPGMVFHSGLGSKRKASKGVLAANWEWYHDDANKRLYYYLDQNPGNYPIEIVRRNGIGFTAVNNLTIRDLEIAFCQFGIGLWGAQKWTIDNVHIHDVTDCGIQGNNATKGITIRNSNFEDWDWKGYDAPFQSPESFFGYGIQAVSQPGTSSDEWVISGNSLRTLHMTNRGADATAIDIDQQGHASLISNNNVDGNNATGGGGIMVWRPRGTADTVIKDNILRNVGAIGINVSEFHVNDFTSMVILQRNIIHHSCHLDMLDQEAVRVWTSNSASVIVDNNLVDGCPKGVNQHYGIRVRESQSVQLYNNTVYGADVGVSIERGSSNALIRNNISAGNRGAAISVESTSTVIEDHNLFYGATNGLTPSATTILTDPLFIDPLGGNFRLQARSLAIDKGASIAAGSTDLDGKSRPQGKGWDIGAYEFVLQKSVLTHPGNFRIVL